MRNSRAQSHARVTSDDGGECSPLSALNFIIQPELIVVSTDTLRSSSEGPHGFSSKILALPHLHGVMCGTGSLDLLVDWHAFVQRRVGALDMRDLDDLAPQQLPTLAKKYRLEKAGVSASIYHFGLDARAGHLRGWKYPSNGGFRSESLIAGLGVKPPRGGPPLSAEHDPLIRLWLEQAKVGGHVHAFQMLMNAQQDLDRLLPSGQRLGIGGEMHIVILPASRQTLWTCCALPHFEDDWNQIRINAEHG